MATASCLYKQQYSHDRGMVLIAGSFQLNGTSAVSAVKGTGFSVARASAGVFNLTLQDAYNSVISAVCSLEHTTEVDSKVLFDALSASAKTAQIRLQSASADAAAASATLTFDTKANSTDEDYIVLSDGQKKIAFVLDVAGDSTALALGGTTLVCDQITAVDISGATTAADVAALFHTAINASDLLVTSVDNTDGTLTVTNDSAGAHGNAENLLSETGSTLLAVTDFTGGTDLGGMADADLSAGRVHFQIWYQKT